MAAHRPTASMIRPNLPTLVPLAGAIALAVGLARPTAAQPVEDPSRLADVDAVELRVAADWDELITTEAGGATADQFLEALRMSFDDAVSGVDAGPGVGEGAEVTVVCHVDTFYDRGLIVYSLRVQTEEPDEDGRPVITWIKSSVGSYSVQQLHLMFRLGEQCAEAFLEDWRASH